MGYKFKLKTMKGCPTKLQGFDFHENQITSLEGCPNSLIDINFENNPLDSKYQDKSIDELIEMIRDDNQKKGFELFRERYLERKYLSLILRKWYIPDENGDCGFARRMGMNSVLLTTV